MQLLRRGRYAVRFAASANDIHRAQQLRWQAFFATRGLGGAIGSDSDAYDPVCRHALVEDISTGALVCCFRLLPLAQGADIGRSYAAQHYDLSALHSYAGKMAEVGRFCIDPGRKDPDILRVAWGALARFVDAQNIKMLFGCSSFSGTNWQAYAKAFAMLEDSYLAPRRFWPGLRAAEFVRLSDALGSRAKPRQIDIHKARQAMPPLLRSYLAMGGWVSDHVVVDRHLDTLHIFTGVEIGAIPVGRAQVLRNQAGSGAIAEVFA